MENGERSESRESTDRIDTTDRTNTTDRTERVERSGTTGSSRYATLVLERKEVLNPGMGNVASHTLLVPKGWQFQGGVQWTPTVDNFVNFVASVQGPDRESLHFDWNRTFRVLELAIAARQLR